MKVLIAGMAHPHVQYVLDECERREGVHLVATTDPDPEQRQRWTPPGTPTFADHADALDRYRPDVVAVFARYGDRGAIVTDALAAGAHVLADKPLCTTLADLDRIETAAANGPHVSVIFEKRWYPETRTVRRLLDSGDLGDLTLIAATGPHKANLDTRPPWFFTADGYGHVLGDLPVHDIDLTLLLGGATHGTVLGASPPPSQPQYPHWHDAGALLLSTDRVTASIEAHWQWPRSSDVHGRYQMRLTGTKGVAELDWAYGQLSVHTHDSVLYTPDLDPGLRPAQQAFDAFEASAVPEVDTQASITATRVALLAAASATDGTPRVF